MFYHIFLSLYLFAYININTEVAYIKYWADAVIVAAAAAAAAVDVVECKTACLRFASENK